MDDLRHRRDGAARLVRLAGDVALSSAAWAPPPTLCVALVQAGTGVVAVDGLQAPVHAGTLCVSRAALGLRAAGARGWLLLSDEPGASRGRVIAGVHPVSGALRGRCEAFFEALDAELALGGHRDEAATRALVELVVLCCMRAAAAGAVHPGGARAAARNRAPGQRDRGGRRLSDPGLLSQITDPDGNVTQISYGANAQVSSIARAPASPGGAQETTRFAYSLSPASPCPSGTYGETTVTDPNGHNTIHCYDGSGRTVLTQNADGNQNAQSWGQDNLPATVTTPDQAPAGAGVNTSLSYDSNHAVTGVTEDTGANSSVNEKISYDPSSPNPYRNFFPASVTDTRGHTTTYNYDSAGNLTSVQNAVGSKNTLSYNGQGEVTGVTDADGHSRTYGYDAANQLTTLTPPQPSSLGTTSIGYDGLSRITSVTDGMGQKRTYCYDNLDRVTQVAFADGSKESYSYDADGNLLTQTDTSPSGASQTTTFAYDALNRPTSSSYPAGKNISYGWDAADNLVSFAGGGGTVTYSYDPADLLTSLTDPVGTTRFGYNAGGNRTSATFPSGASETFSVDASGRMTGITAKGPSGNVLTSQGYSYTGASGSDTMLLQSASDSAGNRYGYTYDAANQLTRASITDGTGNMTDYYQYTYDPAGNHTSQTTKYNGGSYTTQTLTYNAVNELCWSIVGSSSNGCASAPSGANVFSYDGNGNELGSTYSGGFKLTWNAQDQMTSEQDCSTCAVINYAYLGTGQEDRIQEGGSSFENSMLGLSARTYNGTTTTFTRDPQGLVIDDHQGAGSGQCFLYDRQGNVIGLINSSGSLHRTFKYEAPGGVIKDSGTGADTAIRYHGAWNGAGNMYHFGQRDYDPTLREWTQPDPIDQPSDLIQGNWYAYAGNDPINNVDLTGQLSFSLSATACIGICVKASVSVGPDGFGGSLGTGVGLGASLSPSISSANASSSGWDIQASGCGGGLRAPWASTASRSDRAAERAQA